jgi:hypothetical protein
VAEAAGLHALWPTPQQRWLLRAATGDSDRAEEAWAAWQALADPEGDLDRASTELLATVAWNLAREKVDDPLLPMLERFRERVRIDNEALTRQAARVLGLLEDAGIPTLVLKGLALATLYYEDLGARAMADADVAVPADRVREAREVLRQSGFTSSYEPVGARLRFRHSSAYVGPHASLDLHWHVCFESCAPGLDDAFWSHAVPVRVGGAATRALDATDQLLHVLLHGMKWSPVPSLRWLADAAHVVGHGVDWQRLFQQAETLQVGLRVDAALRYLAASLDVDVPDAALDGAAAVPVTRMERLEWRLASAPRAELRGHLRGGLRLVLADFWRLHAQPGLLRSLLALPRYLSFRWSQRDG